MGSDTEFDRIELKVEKSFEIAYNNSERDQAYQHFTDFFKEQRLNYYKVPVNLLP